MFTDAIAWYLFLGGAGSGAVFTLLFVDIVTRRKRSNSAASKITTQKPPREFFAQGFTLSTAVLFLGVLCLLADLGHPERFHYIFLRFNVSIINLGALALSLTLLCSFALALTVGLTLKPSRRFLRVMETLGLASSLATMTYTGILLRSMSAISFWNNLLILPLFVLSALSTGIALIFLPLPLMKTRSCFDKVMERLIRCDLAIIVLEAISALAYFAASSPSSGAEHLLFGSLNMIFWLGFVLCGIVAPAAIEGLFVFGSHRSSASTALPLLVLVGGFALRLCFVRIALH